MKNAPQIQSIGPPADQHAERIMAQMARWIATEGLKLVDGALIVKACRINDATPQGQERVAQTFAKALGPLCLGIAFVQTGKRGKYLIALLMLNVLGPYTEKPLIEVYFKCFQSFGHQRREHFEGSGFSVSHHALSRMAQRLEVRTMEDPVAVLRKLSVEAW
jgi:hypothetical protein